MASLLICLACHKVNPSGGVGKYTGNTLTRCCYIFSLHWFLSLTHLFLHSFSTGPIGAITAMHDAVALANLIYSLPSNTSEEITKAFKEYHAERYPPAVEAYNSSLMLSKLLKGGFTGAIAWFMTNNMPNWLWRISVCYMNYFFYTTLCCHQWSYFTHTSAGSFFLFFLTIG